MNIQLIFSIEVVIISLFLAIFVFAKNKKNLNNIVFSLLAFIVAIWSSLNYISTIAPLETALFWIRLVLFSAVPLQFLFWLFIYIFPEGKLNLSKKFLGFLILLAIGTMIAALSPYVFTKINVSEGNIIPVPGPLMVIFAGTIILFFAWGVFLLFKKYFNASKIEKAQWQYIMAGFISTLVMLISFNFFSIIIFKETAFIALGPLFFVPFIVLTTYSIIRKELFNIKLLSSEIITGLLIFVAFTKFLLAKNLIDRVVDGSFIGAISLFGFLLIKNIKKEIENRKEIEKLALQLQTANEKLKHLDKAKTEFLSIASHQLRTPLTTVKGYSSLLLDGMYGKLSPKIKIIVERIFLSNERLVKLVGELLDISRIERNKFVFKFQYASLKEIINDIVENIQLKAEQKNLKIKYHQPKNKLPLIYLDHDKLYDVFYNLLDNAIKYTEKGSVKISYELRDSEIIVSIKDTGIGLTKEDLSLIFSKFQRGHDSFKMDTEGLGLGLHVAKKIIDAHKGRIWAESPGKNKGATFFVALPISFPLKSNS